MSLQRFLGRPISTMSSSARTSSPFTKAVVQAMRNLYPETLADSSFDNTGLLLEAPYRPNYLNNSVLLTIDLTKAVVDEAIRRKDSIVIAYHPIIFRPLKAITLDNSQQDSLLRLTQEGISVYSPHTAVDAAPGGLNEWLVDIVTAKERSRTVDSGAVIPHSLSVVTPVKDVPDGFDGAGYGRVVRFQTPQTLSAIIRRIADHLGVPYVNVAVPQNVHHKYKANIEIYSVGICAGSGGSILNGLDVDLLFTGEMGHHEALAAIEQGRCVITAFHSNTERGFLASRMKSALEKEIEKEIHAVVENKEEDVFDTSVSVEVSQKDRDPFVIVNAEDFY